MKRILTRESYLREINLKYYKKYTGVEPINEEAPFANDAPWGDTLIGRLINSFARKGKIAFNKRRISGLVSRLKSIFDEMLETGNIEISNDDIRFLKISNLLGELEKQVRDEEDVDILISTTTDLIELVNSYQFEFQEEMLKSLNDFLEYLKSLKKGEPIDPSTESDTNVSEIFYKQSKLFLQSVLDLHMMIKQNVVRIGGGQESYDNKLASAKSKLKVGNEYNYLNSEGETIRCMLLSLTNKIERAADKKWLTEDDAVGSPAFSKFRKLEPDQACVVYKKDKDGKDVKDYNSVYNSQVVEILKIYSLDGKMPGKIEKPGENLSTNFNKDKYSDLEKKYLSSKKYEILKNLIKMGGQGIKIYTAKKDNQNSKFYTDKTNNYISILVKMQAKSYGISTEETKDFKQPDGTIKKKPTGKHKDIKTLKDEIRDASKEVWSVDLPLGKSSGKVSQPPTGVAATMQKASYNIETDFDSIFEEVESNLQSEESHAKNAWKKVINAYNQSKISSFVPQIEDLLKISIKDGKDKFLQSKKDIIAICKQTVLNKSTVGKPISFDDLIKEAVNVNDISKSISLFGRVLLSYKEDMGLTGGYGSAISPLKSFINSFTELEKTLPKIKTESNKEEVKESISRYNNFILLKEKNEYSSQITEKFDEIFTEDIQKYFTITEERISDFNNRVKKRESMVFTDADPIIEIVRLFNRAWRIHTPGVIPSGRTGGKVSNSVFREYEDLGDRGGTPDTPGSGPYRNIELYEAWFEAVQDILSDTKYRPIFSDDVVFQFQNIETGEVGDSVPKAGKILLKFVNELLSDTKMYKAGAMNKFIQEYFNLDSKEIPKTYGEFENDGKDNDETSSGVKETNVVFKKIEQVKGIDFAGNDLWKVFTERNRDDFKNLAFRLKVKKDDTISSYYCVYQQTSENYPIVIFRSDAFPFDLTKVSSRDIPRNINRTIKTNLASLPKSGGFLKKGSKSLFRYVDLGDPGESKVNSSSGKNRIEFEIQEIEVLCIVESGEPYLDLDNYLSILKADITRGYNIALNNIKKY